VRRATAASSAQRCAFEAALTASADALLDLLQAVDAFRRPDRFDEWLAVCAFDGGDAAASGRLRRARSAASAVDAGAVARAHPEDIPGAIRAARLAAIGAAVQ